MALVKALKEGWIAGAGLDVFPQEPPPTEHPIFDCPNVVMTPHTSGWSPDRQTRLIEFFAENVRRYSSGLPLMNVVDKKRAIDRPGCFSIRGCGTGRRECLRRS